ncbi:hypothetical protein JRO89_XS13G0189100 [Xanthoceras sorbifolium]|uniref:Uncharacterized protein n=1 Tax=Xanthoceras sorbifolium TaxID=99658 RepID=A0ABQ8H958_9ROSI|nr:hypothetical protein JRO89_XS13G0189100 [Xanthoceras sorbifolium]
MGINRIYTKYGVATANPIIKLWYPSGFGDAFCAKFVLSLKISDSGAKSDCFVIMAFLLKNSIASHLRSHSQVLFIYFLNIYKSPIDLKTEDALSLTRRGFHVELGAREKALVAEDPALKRYKSTKKSVQLVKRLGDVLTIVVVAVAAIVDGCAAWVMFRLMNVFQYGLSSCCYEIYVRAVMREEARKLAKGATESA